MKKGNKKKVSSVTESTLPKIKNKNSKSKSPQQKVTSAKSKNSTTINEEKINNITSIKYNNNTSNTSKLDEYNEKRKKRLLLEKKEEERDKKIYEQVLKEFQNNKVKNENKNKTKLTEGKNRNNDINYQLPNIKISEKKTQKILEEGGMLDAYKYLIIQLCKNGLPIGNLFEYSAMVIKNYEKKWKDKKAKLKKEQVEQYWKEKKEQIDSFSELQKSVNLEKSKNFLDEKNKIKLLSRSLEQREMNKLIQSLDRSRSPRNINTKLIKTKSEKQLTLNQDMKTIINQKEKKSNKNKKNCGKKSKSPKSANKPKKSILKEKSKSPQTSRGQNKSKNKK